MATLIRVCRGGTKLYCRGYSPLFGHQTALVRVTRQVTGHWWDWGIQSLFLDKRLYLCYKANKIESWKVKNEEIRNILASRHG